MKWIAKMLLNVGNEAKIKWVPP